MPFCFFFKYINLRGAHCDYLHRDEYLNILLHKIKTTKSGELWDRISLYLAIFYVKPAGLGIKSYFSTYIQSHRLRSRLRLIRQL